MNLDVIGNFTAEGSAVYQVSYPQSMASSIVQSSNCEGDEEMLVDEPAAQYVAEGGNPSCGSHRIEEAESGTATPDTNPRTNTMADTCAPVKRDDQFPPSRSWTPMASESDLSLYLTASVSSRMSLVEEHEGALQSDHGRNMATLQKWEDLLKSRPKDPMAFYWREMIAWCRARAGRPCVDDDEPAGAKRVANVSNEYDESVDMLDRLVKRCRCNDDVSCFQAAEPH
ncbi:hypothetical protein GUITHDRAFT_156222 [Guillardia theta CCMP2712]|uniref:Uncharacterized protein n=1 Tax=Guillardia theta (strain CCMP2712) TaxID=905079 RepID=L1IAC1_GUITC|nr:hypothetical protein GUITHDRAFT_156222 [Guillardia theta CCMP2712]EKX32834.1 hypothetical protein GUITHDRAFT_156222 [Guillardia theta CCMP2712]|mmetsp:Transcript_27812/g.90472  ORF Transcript_27812/g.90472 Transcript_27812/m.90472 type:complete len:227 (-) Transcript_27812:88-768(-)|eukprot:XP_005819814.1 hypothetical protein GUITHDRAFT_156222 [Guillardia theta CCMP2712]